MIKKDNTSKQIRIYCLVVGIISFFIVSVCGQLLNRNTVNEEKMRAAFTAETTVNRIKSQLNRYLDVSEFFQNIIGSGHQMDSKEFQALSQMISDDSQIIKVIEQAPDGVVNELNAEIAETVLVEAGIEVKRVEDGLQCIEELKKMPENYYDVILMDVQMPNMDGYTATQRIRDLDDSRAEIPIIAMTANAYDEDRRKAQEAGMDGFLAKPLDVDEMMRLLGKITKTE